MKLGSHHGGTGLPAKSGVSGVIVAVATGCEGIAVASLRGQIMREFRAQQLGWHFTLPRRGRRGTHDSFQGEEATGYADAKRWKAQS